MGTRGVNAFNNNTILLYGNVETTSGVFGHGIAFRSVVPLEIFTRRLFYTFCTWNRAVGYTTETAAAAYIVAKLFITRATHSAETTYTAIEHDGGGSHAFHNIPVLVYINALRRRFTLYNCGLTSDADGTPRWYYYYLFISAFHPNLILTRRRARLSRQKLCAPTDRIEGKRTINKEDVRRRSRFLFYFTRLVLLVFEKRWKYFRKIITPRER